MGSGVKYERTQNVDRSTGALESHNFSKPIKDYILRMISKARLVRATVDVHISSVNPKMTGPPLHCKGGPVKAL